MKTGIKKTGIMKTIGCVFTVVLIAFVLILSQMVRAEAEQAPSKMVILKSFALTTRTKWLSIVDGELRSGDTFMQAPTPVSCLVENLRLRKTKFEAHQEIPLKFEKIEFPNKSIIRYSLISQREYSIGCDLTLYEGDLDSVEQVRAAINAALAPFAKVQ